MRRVIFPLLLLFAFSCSEEKEVHEEEKNGMSGMENMIMLTKQQMIIAGITLDTVRTKSISEFTTLTGTAVINENELRIISSRVKGRIEHLYLRNTGEYISRGKPLYTIYSEELLADEKDYLLALTQYENAQSQKEMAKQLVAAARKKLLLWTISEEQIKELEKSRMPFSNLTFFSSESGFLTELLVREGEYVDAGTPIAKIAELNSIWVEAQVYSDEIKFLTHDLQLSVEFETFPGKLFTGVIAFDNPSLEKNQKISIIRVKIDNRKNEIKPGMMAMIYIQRNEKKTLVIPKSALLVEKMISVWVQAPDGMYEPRMVTTGIENKTEIEILSGLKEREIVVISGAYFLKSEMTVKQGGGDMGGMEM